MQRDYFFLKLQCSMQHAQEFLFLPQLQLLPFRERMTTTENTAQIITATMINTVKLTASETKKSTSLEYNKRNQPCNAGIHYRNPTHKQP